MGDGGKWEHEIWTDLCAERRINLQFQGVGAHPWLPGRRSGRAREINNPLIEADRSSRKQILPEAQWRLNAMPQRGGFSAYRMVFGSKPGDFFGREEENGDLLFTQDTSLAVQFAQQWELRMRALEAALKEVAKSKLRRLLAYNKSVNCAGITTGDSVLS